MSYLFWTSFYLLVLLVAITNSQSDSPNGSSDVQNTATTLPEAITTTNGTNPGNNPEKGAKDYLLIGGIVIIVIALMVGLFLCLCYLCKCFSNKSIVFNSISIVFRFISGPKKK